MKHRTLFLFILAFLAFLISACTNVGAATNSHSIETPITQSTSISPKLSPTLPTVLLTLSPIQATPVLQSYYLYSSSTTLIFLDFADSTDNRASTTAQDNVYGKPCLMTYNELMTYTQSGNQLHIQALYVTDNPFTINEDGPLTTSETDEATGQIIVETFMPSSIQAYNTALAHLQKKMVHC